MRIRIAPLALLAALLFFIAAAPAEAKGDSYLVGARLFGGRLGDRSITVPIALPENYDDMYEAEPPAGVWGSVAQGAGFHIAFTYDFGEYGYGTRERLGWYDGYDRLFFPEAMHVGPGTWAAGWFTASKELALQLRRALAPPAPAAGNAGAAGPGEPNLFALAGLLVVAAGLAGIRCLRPLRR